MGEQKRPSVSLSSMLLSVVSVPVLVSAVSAPVMSTATIIMIGYKTAPKRG